MERNVPHLQTFQDICSHDGRRFSGRRTRVRNLGAVAKRPPLAAVDWEGLSPEGTWRLQRIAVPVACGLSYGEIALSLGWSSRRVSAELDELAEELRRGATANPTPLNVFRRHVLRYQSPAPVELSPAARRFATLPSAPRGSVTR